MIGDACVIKKINDIKIAHIAVSLIVPYDELLPVSDVSDVSAMELDGEDLYVI